MITKMNHKKLALGVFATFCLLFIIVGCQKNINNPNPQNQDCSNDFNYETIKANGVIGNYIWYTDYTSGLWSVPAFSISNKSNTDSLIFSFLGYVKKSNSNYPLAIDFHLIIKNKKITKYRELINLDNTIIKLSDSTNYILFVDYHWNRLADSSLFDTIRVTTGNVTFSQVFKVCSINYCPPPPSTDCLKAFRMLGTFYFSIPNGTKYLITGGSFDFFLSPDNRDIHFDNW